MDKGQLGMLEVAQEERQIPPNERGGVLRQATEGRVLWRLPLWWKFGRMHFAQPVANVQVLPVRHAYERDRAIA